MLIINPIAGKGGGVNSLGAVTQVLFDGGFLPTVFYTKAQGDATKYVLEHGSEYEYVTCVGGDGTLSETISGLMKLENPPILGYIPQGTANDIASTLQLPKYPALAAKTIVNGKVSPIDVGQFNKEEYFTYVAAFGAFTEVSYETPREYKQSLGQIAYILQGMGQLTKLTHYPTRVEYDGGVIEGDMVFGSVSNSTSIAGIVKLTDVGIELSDGLFEVILIRNPKNVLEMNQIVTNILSNKFAGTQVTMLRSKMVKFTFDRPVKWTRDGESGGAHQEVLLENIHCPLKIMMRNDTKSS